MGEEIFDDAKEERERQRSEGEARAIIHDLDKLYTFDEEKKTRWIWELLQNAKDVASEQRVDISVKLTKDELTFSHNGLPFKTTHLLALLYKTSTKSLGGEGGTTGKYGTGFVTTHILSKKVKISGVHENIVGKRHFDFYIDRAISYHDESSALMAMQERLAQTFLVIDHINKTQPETIQSNWNSFTYPLNAESLIYADKGIQELERNVAFTLLINPRIKSISIEVESSIRTYLAAPEETSIKNVSFLSTKEDCGLLFTNSGKLTIAISAMKAQNGFKLLPIDGRANLYKEFPLIGTENFNLPVFIQHSDFHPTEQRDGIRTKKLSAEEDPIADKNRAALLEFVALYLGFIKAVIEANTTNSYLFAKSGLPEYVEKYSNIDWYQENIQFPIRQFILQQDIVTAADGSCKKIENIRFPSLQLFKNDEFYSLVSELVPMLVPDKESVWHWCEMISQEPSSWPTGISINEEELVKLVPDHAKIETDAGIDWLKRFYKYLEANNINHWGEKYPIYLNEANNFCLRDKVSIHPNIDDEFKIVSRGLGRCLDSEFLNRKLGLVSAIKEFDLNEFYSNLNKVMISELKTELATEAQVKAIFHVCTFFRSERSSKREKWYQIIKQLLPEIIGERKQITVDYDNYWRSAELWSIKYICSLIEKSGRPTVFAGKYFQSDITSCYEWLRDFLIYVFQLNDESSDVFFKRSIIPNQADTFKPYDDYIFAEDDGKYFDDTIKNIYRDFTGKGDPRNFIIERKIYFEGLRTHDVSVLTSEIDKLFIAQNIETKVKKGGALNEMFLLLNDWFEKFSKPTNLLPTFASNRASLYVLALGDGFSKQIMEMKSTGRTIEEITELAKTQLTNEAIKQFEDAAGVLGLDKLLQKTQEMVQTQALINRWKRIGDAAEIAFEEAISGLDFDCKIENPDRGRDFDLIINTQGYSIEIKSVVEGKENVKMSILQGRTAVIQRDNYALCVLTRPSDDNHVVDKAYFIANSLFVIDIGYQIGDKITDWDNGLQTLQFDSDIKVQLEDKTESVYINRRIWRTGIPFDDFILKVKNLISENDTH